MPQLRFAALTPWLFLASILLHSGPFASAQTQVGRSADGTLNLDLELGTLDHWTVEGEAFAGQPIEGDTVAPRRSDSGSRHEGKYWIGGFEKLGDAPKGTMTSAPFAVKAPYATFLVGGGAVDHVRVEVWIEGSEKPLYAVGGNMREDMFPVLVDLRDVQQKKMFIRLVDDSSGGWGHINFDHFRFHDQRPSDVEIEASKPLVDDEYPFAGLAADEAAAAMIVPEGFKVIAMASEPDVKQPVAMAIDDRGRIWIAEAYEYPKRAQGDSGKDRILIFEDTDGDGKLDSRKVFAEGLNLVSGFEVGFGGVWVGAAPYLMFIPDANQDDVPDSSPEILLDGWGHHDTHETLNTFTWGPDGWLYGCHGVFTHSRVGKPGTAKEDRVPINAGVWRYHPVRHEFEVFAHGTSNPWGLDFNEVGEAFVTACVIPHLFHIIPEARYLRQAGDHFNRYTYKGIDTIADHLHYLGATPHSGNNKSDAAGGGHAHCGAMIYQGGKWPEQYRGAIFMNNIHGQRLNVDLLTAKGSGYVGSHASDFLLTRDQASQIINMQYGPDGDVIFIDWYDMQACHRNEEVHDRTNGRIYKVYFGAMEPSKIDLSKKSDLELATLNVMDNQWYVRHSRRLLQERAARGEVSPNAIMMLKERIETAKTLKERLNAIWTLHAMDAIDDELSDQLLEDSESHVRAWAVRLLMQRVQYQASDAQLARLVKMAEHDASPVVRLALASAANRLPLDSRWDLLTQLTSHAEDRDDHNLPSVVWYAMEPLAKQDADRGLALGLKAGQSIPQLGEFMLRRIAQLGDIDSIDRLVRGLEKVQSGDLQLTFLSAIRAALVGKRQAAQPEAWPGVYEHLRRSSDPRVQREAMSLGVTFGDPAAMQSMRSQLVDPASQSVDRIAALDALLSAGDSGLADTLVALVDDPNGSSDELVEKAIRGLAQFELPKASQVLLTKYQALNESQRRASIATLCSRKTSAHALLGAIESGQIKAADLTADLARQIDYLGDPELSELLTRVWGSVRKTSKEKTELIAKYKFLVARTDLSPPDIALGRTLFAKTCQRCHGMYGIGEKLGPDITGSNRANLDYLLENIVDPSSVMAKEYHQSIILTVSGQVITGIVRAEDENSVTIQTAEALVVVPKDEIDSQNESQQSMMPDDQLGQFDEHQVRSLFAYLRSESQSPLLATAENAPGLFNGKDLKGWHGNSQLWSVQNGEIVGQSPGISRNEFLVSDYLVRDFKLTVEVMLVDNKGNSGIQFRSQGAGDGDVKGYQADIGAGWWGKLYEEHGRGLLWKKGAGSALKSGEWNLYEIEAVGSHVRTWLNGELSVDLDDPDGAKEGIIALQIHSGGPMEVRFRNLKLEAR